jgi:hypothetical protein
MVGHLQKLWQKKKRKSLKEENKKIQKKGGPWVPGRGGSKNISSRAFLIFMIVKTSYHGVESPQDWYKQTNLKKIRKRERRLGSSIKNRPGEKYQGDQRVIVCAHSLGHPDLLENYKSTQQRQLNKKHKTEHNENWSDKDIGSSQWDGKYFFPVTAEDNFSKR